MKSNQKIQCPDLDTFMAVIAKLAAAQLGFIADADLMVIYLNGSM